MTPEGIVRAVGDAFGYDRGTMLAQRRFHRHVVARGVAAMLMRDLLKMSLMEIASELRRRDHTTIINCIEVARRDAAGCPGPDQDALYVAMNALMPAKLPGETREVFLGL